LLHQAIDTRLVASLEQGGNGKGRNGSVGVCDESLNVGVALTNGVGLERSKVVEDADGGKLCNGARGGQEELEDVDGLEDLLIGHIGHVADGLGSFNVDQLALITQPSFEQLHHGGAQRGIFFDELGSQTDEHETSCRTLDNTSGAVLLNHFDESHAVVGSHLVEQTDGVVLGHEVCVGGSKTVRGGCAKAE
jgi:hypothetical protein